MTLIRDLNFWLTVVSIIVTIISIRSSIWSFRSAKNAEAYKKDVQKVMQTLGLKSITESYYIESSRFQAQTRKADWFKGIDVNTIISPFSDVLAKLGAVYPILNDPQGIKTKVNVLYRHIQQYDKATESTRKDYTNLIIEITNIFQSEIHTKTYTVI